MSASKINKIGNEYADATGRLYERTPKAVFAAIAVSSLTIGGDYLARAEQRVLHEWWMLHLNGIVPQRPPVPDPGQDSE